jgi:hypothetical protein
MGRLPREETSKACINIQLVRIELVTLIDWEHGIGMHNIEPAPATHHVIQVGYNTELAMYKKNECRQSINVCVNKDAREINPVFPLQVNNNPLAKIQILCLYLNLGSHENI